MEFYSKWVCHPDFVGAEGPDFYSKEINTKNKLAKEDPHQNHHAYFAGKVMAKEGASYLARVSADDYYKLYVNGSFVCQGPSPSYRQFYAYNEADLTPYLKDGENVIALHVFYQGLLNRVWNSADGREGAILDLFEDGKYVFGTDEGWVCHMSEEYEIGYVIGYKTQFMENLNFTKKIPNLAMMQGEGWQSVAVNPDHGHDFCDLVPTVEVYRKKPVLTVEREDGYFFDFGQEIVGQPYLLAKGKAGDTVVVVCSEEQVEGDTLCLNPMRANCNYRETCTLSGNVDEFDFYDYRGFRYVNLFVEDKSVLDLDSFCAIVRHHPFPRDKGTYEGNDPKLAAIWELCRNTIQYSTQEIIPDCPTREKGQYLGDFTVTGLSHLYLTGDVEKYRKTLFDFARSTMICPGMMAIAPCAHMQEIADFSLQYPLQVWNYYKVTGDKATVTRLLPTVRGILFHFSRFENEDGLLVGVTDKWNIVDWPKGFRDGYDLDLVIPIAPDAVHNVLNAHYMGAMLTLSQLEDATEEPRTFSDEELERRKCLFRDTFYLPDRGLYADVPVSLYKEREAEPHSAFHSNILPAFYGFAEEKSKPAILAMIEEKGLCCGVQFSYFVLKACSRLGDRDLEYRLLTNESENSWMNMLREGATTTFEAWGKEQKDNTSLCHPWATAPIIAITEDLKN